MALNQTLKARLEARDAMLVPGAANALAARIIADLGFEAVYVTGAGIANTRLGVPDVGLVTLTELAGEVEAIAGAVDLPLIVDADTGFGNAINVRRTVRLLERCGAAAIQIEDQTFPKKCGHFEGKDVIDAAEMVQKIHAAVDARRSEATLIVARTDALAPRGLPDALERASRYVEAGADVMFVEAPRTREEMRAVAASLPVPQIANMVIGGRTPLLGRAELREMGFSLVLYANAALQAAVFGMQRALTALRADGLLDLSFEGLAGFEERQRLVGKPAYDELERRYASASDS